WERVINVNARGTFNVTRAFGRAMVRNGGGSIVAVSSNAAGIPRLNMGAYAASKAAATMLVRCLGLELAAQGVRCNIVAPGSTLTPMQTGMWTEDGGAGERAVIEGSLDAYRTGIPLKKLATPEDIAGAVMFMLSDQAGHVTMADLYVDGGPTQRAYRRAAISAHQLSSVGSRASSSKLASMPICFNSDEKVITAMESSP